MHIPRCSLLLAASLSLGAYHSAAVQDDGWRTIEFETSEVTGPDVAVAPDGEWLIFTMLGHLFRLPVEGGTAEQLTFGPYYDTDPVFSPDGSRVAFVSDRDGSEGNIFVLELATGQITQVTDEPWAGRSTWAPDGQAIVYLRFLRDSAGPTQSIVRPGPLPALVRRVSLSGGEPETLSADPREIRSVFYLPDGRLAWTVLIEGEIGSPRYSTRIEVMSAQGTVSTLRTLEGFADRVVPSATGDGLFCRRYLRLWTSFAIPEREDVIFLPLPDGPERRVVPLALAPRWRWRPGFALAPDNESLYLGEAGRLWKSALHGGARKPIRFSVRVKLEVRDPVPPANPFLAASGSSEPPRSVMGVSLSPDGRRLVFAAAGYIWHQTLDGGSALRLFAGRAFEREPMFSPDGRRLAFLHTEDGNDEIRVFDFESRQVRTLASALSPWGLWGLSWSADGRRLAFNDSRVLAVNVISGERDTLALDAMSPHFSADGDWLFYTAANSTLYRLPLRTAADPEPITQLKGLSGGRVSPDGKWLVFQRNLEVWMAPLGTEPVREEDVRRLSPGGVEELWGFTPDGSAVIYSAGNRVWRHPLIGGERQEIPIRLELPRPTPPPVLLRSVRVLDFATGDFGSETSLFIEQGRIRWIGSEGGRELPRETSVLEAAGRFLIPGLFDLHVHADGTYDLTPFLAYGVTSVRSPGSWLASANAVADRGEASNDPVPRYFYSGRRVGRGIRTEDDARTSVRRLKEWGSQFIKLSTTTSWPLQRAAAAEARRLGLPVVAHGSSVEEMTKGVTLGYTTLEHNNSYPHHPYDDLLQLLATAGVRWDPTLGTQGGNHLLLRDEPERLADAKFRVFATQPCIRRAERAIWFGADVETTAWRGFWVEQLETIRAAHRRGVKLHAGTDMEGECFPGLSLHWELEHFARAGLPPLDVLRIATQEGAAAVGAEDDLGTLEVGKLADIVLLDANPLDDIKNTQTIWRVIKGGWVFDPEALRPSRN